VGGCAGVGYNRNRGPNGFAVQVVKTCSLREPDQVDLASIGPGRGDVETCEVLRSAIVNFNKANSGPSQSTIDRGDNESCVLG